MKKNLIRLIPPFAISIITIVLVFYLKDYNYGRMLGLWIGNFLQMLIVSYLFSRGEIKDKNYTKAFYNSLITSIVIGVLLSYSQLKN